MVNPVDIGLRIAQALDSIGIKMGSYIGKSSNIKKAMFGGKPTMFKPNALEALRGTGSNFDDALRLIEEESKFIVNATDAEKMAFLNNVNDYKQFGGPLKTDVVARTKFEEGIGSLKDDIKSLQTTAKTMKDDAEKGLKSAEDDLKVFLETGGNPLKKEDKKFLGGSMHEEGQIRTGIRQFLQNELKNGRIKLDDLDKARVMEYSPMIEHDPILVFKKIYGNEAYKKAGTFPGAFEIGEDFNHYRTIFESKMGEDILKVKDKKYVGDGTLTLTDEVRTPTPDDDVPFAKGGRASFAGGGGAKKIVQEIIEYITTKFTPIDAMKEVNKVIGKTGKYKNLKLTDDDINEIVEGSNDFIFQRDPDNLYVEGSIKEKTEYLDEDDVLERDLFAPKSDTQVFKDSEGGIKGITMGGDDEFKKAMSEAMEEGMRESENMKRLGLDPTKMEDALKYDEMKAAGQLEKNITGSSDLSPAEDLMKKYPGMSRELAEQIANDPNPERKAKVLAMVDQTFELNKQGKSGDEIIDIFKQGTDRTKQADGGITKLRNGYYGGGQAMIEPDLSDIGHGSDSLMSRTRLSAPGSQATTSTGLNYLLGEDNDNTRIPFNEGLLVPPKKPYTPDMFEKDSMTLLQGMYGTGKDSNEFLYNEMIKKGNMLRKQGVERETVIEIIRNNKDKINAFLETQTTSPKSFEGLESFEMKANGGRIGYATKGKVDLSDLESLKGLKKARGEDETGLGVLGRQMSPSAARSQRNKILDKAIAKLTYAVDNLDQETKEKVISAFNDQLKIGYETTMSGLKMDAADQVGIVPIDKETIYKAIVNMDLPKETKLEIEALSNMAGDEELAFSLSNNNLGITYDNESQTIVGKYKFDFKDGKTSITPSITKDQDSEIQSRIKINKAIEDGQIDLDLTKDTTDNSLTTDFSLIKDGNTLTAKNVSGTDDNYFKAEGTAEVPFYMLKDGQSPYISSEYYKDDGSNYLETSLGVPITRNLEASLSNLNRYDGSHVNTLGVNYKKYIDNIFTKNKSLDNRGIVSFDANIDSDKNKFAGINFSFPLGNNKTNNIGNMNFDNAFLSRDEKEALEREKLENTMYYKDKAYQKNNIYSGNDFNELIEATKDNLTIGDFIGPKLMAQGGIAGLRQGYVGGGGVNLARRGFLKVLAGTGAAVAAFKTGALKLLGKSTTKAAPKLFTAAEGSGAPAWFEGMVNKVLADGVDITKKAATMDGQTVKSLDTPTGKVDVTIDRTGNIDVNYMGDNTAMGEGVDMRYVVGQADEGTKGVKPADEFEAVESIPQLDSSSGNFSGSHQIAEMGENSSSNLDNLYSDTSELAELGGQKILIKDISNSIKNKQTLKKMNENPEEFAMENAPEYYD